MFFLNLSAVFFAQIDFCRFVQGNPLSIMGPGLGARDQGPGAVASDLAHWFGPGQWPGSGHRRGPGQRPWPGHWPWLLSALQLAHLETNCMPCCFEDFLGSPCFLSATVALLGQGRRLLAPPSGPCVGRLGPIGPSARPLALAPECSPAGPSGHEMYAFLI